MGIYKAKKPLFPKELIWPALTIMSTTFINQAKPYPSFHPLCEGLQHALRPDRMFHPVPFYREGFSWLFSLFQHCPRFDFILSGQSPSTFLHPFAPRALPRFLALTGALTPAGWALRPPCFQQVSLVHIAQPSSHSVTKHLTRPVIAFSLPAQRDRLPGALDNGVSHVSRSGLRPLSAGSSQRAAESCSLSYGLRVRLRLLSTPPHGDAVTIGYRERASPGRGLSPPRSRLLPGARIPASAEILKRYIFLHVEPVLSNPQAAGLDILRVRLYLCKIKYGGIS